MRSFHLKIGGEILRGNPELLAFLCGRQAFFNSCGELRLSTFSHGKQKAVFLLILHYFSRT